MKKFIIIMVIFMILLGYLFNLNNNKNKQDIYDRINNIGGTVISIELKQEHEIGIYHISYIDKDNQPKRAIYVTGSGYSPEFSLIED